MHPRKSRPVKGGFALGGSVRALREPDSSGSQLSGTTNLAPARPGAAAHRQIGRTAAHTAMVTTDQNHEEWNGAEPQVVSAWDGSPARYAVR